MTSGLQENENRDPSSEKAAHTPALLDMFCEDMVPRDNIRHAPVTFPFAGEPWTFGTDGSLAVALRGADHGYGPRPECKFKAAEFMEQFSAMPMAKRVVSLAVMAKFVKDVAESGESTWKATQAIKIATPCEKCEDKSEVTCKACHGDGTHDCSQCGDEHDCRRCDGNGTIPCSCTRKEIEIEQREFVFGGICFDARLLHKALRHLVLRWDVAQVGVIPDPREPRVGLLVIVHDEFRVFLMSLRTRDDVLTTAPEYVP